MRKKRKAPAVESAPAPAVEPVEPMPEPAMESAPAPAVEPVEPTPEPAVEPVEPMPEPAMESAPAVEPVEPMPEPAMESAPAPAPAVEPVEPTPEPAVDPAPAPARKKIRYSPALRVDPVDVSWRSMSSIEERNALVVEILRGRLLPGALAFKREEAARVLGTSGDRLTTRLFEDLVKKKLLQRTGKEGYYGIVE